MIAVLGHIPPNVATAVERPLFALAMLASVGAGASLTLALTEPPRVVAAASHMPAEESGATVALSRVTVALPHRPELERTTPDEPLPLVVASRSDDPEVTGMIKPMPMVRSPKAAEVKSWHYQLQNIDPRAIARSAGDLAVVDYMGKKGPFSRADIAAMQRKPDGSRRLVLAYLSIGEAEDYRFYWNSDWRSHPPSWLGKENPSWRGNYAVRFWDPSWQDIVFDYAERIVAAGFDGIYLDRVDQFENLGHKDAMVEFVTRLAEKAKAKHEGFLVVSQNGDALIPDRRFRAAIDAFAREDLFYGEDKDGVRNTADSIRASVGRLKLLANEKKPVLVVEYPRNDEQARTVAEEISALGFIALTTRRDLDAL